ncbi:TRAM/LAG1/CLN8 homology domain-containing protein, partial [Chytridium lagenaria]
KFATATWKFVNYAIMTIIGAYVLAYEPWIFDTQEYFKGWPEEHSIDKMKFYYHAAFGSGAYMLISIFTDPKQKDFYQMLTHHILTLTIVTASYLLGFYRIGSVIMLLHDVSDPFMEIAKMFVYR